MVVILNVRRAGGGEQRGEGGAQQTNEMKKNFFLTPALHFHPCPAVELVDVAVSPHAVLVAVAPWLTAVVVAHPFFAEEEDAANAAGGPPPL